MLKRGLRLLLITVITLVVTLGGFEIVVRAVPLYPDRFARPHPVYGWDYPANGGGTWLNAGCPREFINAVTFNGHGLHDVEHTYERATDARRILILGDSMVASLEVPIEVLMPRLLEADLNADPDRTTDTEVIAVGHQGYGVDLSLRYYEALAHQYDADLVLFLMQPHNDITDNDYALRSNAFVFPAPHYTLEADGSLLLHEPPPYQPTAADWLRSSFRAYALLELRLWQRSLPTRDAVLTPEQEAAAIEVGIAYEAAYERAWALTFALMRRLNERVTADGAQFAVALERTVLPADEAQILNTRIGGELDALGIRHIDLFDPLETAITPDTPTRYACDGHWTPHGHRVVADALLPFVR